MCQDTGPCVQITSIAARLNRLPPIPTHRTATIIAGIGSFFDLFDIFLAGVLGTVLTQQFRLTRVALPAVIGSGFVGMFVGATLLAIGYQIFMGWVNTNPEVPKVSIETETTAVG